MIGILATFVIALLLAVPVLWAARSERKITWTSAVVLGTLIGAIGILLIGELPSRMLYWFDANADTLATQYGFLEFLAGDLYIAFRDIVVNTVQILLFVVMMVVAYKWCEGHRRAGRFKS